jgi:hypothetical protein
MMARVRRFVVAIIALALTGGLAAYVCAGAGPAAANAAALGPTIGTSPTSGGRPSQANCSQTSVGLTPLTTLGRGRFDGYQGGLYPGGHNAPPRRYLKAGLAAAARVRPLAPNGTPSRSGRVGVLSVGMSNAYLEYVSFIHLAANHPVAAGDLGVAGAVTRNPRVELVNGSTPDWDATRIIGNQASYLGILDHDVAVAGLTGNQVQAVWLYEAIANEHKPFPADAKQLRSDLTTIIAMLTAHFPNLRLVYLSSREYGGYAITKISPEPYAYDSGFAVKWTVARRTANPGSRPWVAWGPYTWADGTVARSDGLSWTCADFEGDGTHPSAQGAAKVAYRLLSFFTTNRTTRSWFDG